MGIKIKGAEGGMRGKISDADWNTFDVEIINHDHFDGTARVQLVNRTDRPKNWGDRSDEYVLDGTRPLPKGTDFYFSTYGILYDLHEEKNEAEDGVWEIEYGPTGLLCKMFVKIRGGEIFNVYDERISPTNPVAVKRIGDL